MATARWLGLYVDLLCAIFLVGVAIVGMLVIQDQGKYNSKVFAN